MTTKELIKKLEEMPEDYEVRIFEQGRSSDDPIKRVYISATHRMSKDKFVFISY